MGRCCHTPESYVADDGEPEVRQAGAAVISDEDVRLDSAYLAWLRSRMGGRTDPMEITVDNVLGVQVAETFRNI